MCECVCDCAREQAQSSLSARIAEADKELTAARRDAAAQVLELEARVEHVTVAAAESARAFQKQVRCTADCASAAAVWCALRLCVRRPACLGVCRWRR
jgi:hypothetical protein